MNPKDWGKSQRELQEPCDCCIDGPEGEALIYIDDITTYIDYGKLITEVDEGDGYATKISIKINYCPMCGRKLEVEG